MENFESGLVTLPIEFLPTIFLLSIMSISSYYIKAKLVPRSCLQLEGQQQADNGLAA